MLVMPQIQNFISWEELHVYFETTSNVCVCVHELFKRPSYTFALTYGDD
jgi:hypothetical protein